jgi:phosphopantothenoylcysteine decarboxylase / phosphopantothenate---cysteine ligase
MARILLGVTGGIAAYKALEFTRLAIKGGHSVRIIETEAATRFVGKASFAGISGAPVLVSQWEPDPLRGAFPGDPIPEHIPLSHLQLVENADIFVIAPASANTIAKLAHGFADNLLTVAALASRIPLLIAPAMNNAMYENPETQANISHLRERGVVILEPVVGELGSIGEWGVGRMVEPAEILTKCEQTLSEPSATNHPSISDCSRSVAYSQQNTTASRIGASATSDPGASVPAQSASAPTQPNSWSTKRVLITAGGTREPIDEVRFIGNRSSGRMGFALAREAAKRGANVTVIAANVALPLEPDITYIRVATAAELWAESRSLFGDCDVLFMTAAVADFRPAEEVKGKIKKDKISKHLRLELKKTDDILAGITKIKRANQIVVGFAAESGAQAVEYGKQKLNNKRLDAIVINDIKRSDIGFDSNDNEVTVATPSEEIHLAKAAKEKIASGILDVVTTLLSR